MLDLNFIRENKELVKKNAERRGVNPKKADIDRLLTLDEQKRKLTTETDALRAKKNDLAGQFVKADETGKAKLKTEGETLKEQTQKNEETLRALEKEIIELLAWIPNILSKDTPEGKGEDDNTEIKVWHPEKGYLPKGKLGKATNNKSEKFMGKLPFDGKNHIALGEKLGIIDLKQAAKVSGTRFYYLRGDAVLLQNAMQQFLATELNKRGFTPTMPPILIRERALYGTSHFPEGYDQVYRIENDNVEDNNKLYLAGTSEPSNFAYFMDTTLSDKELPAKLYSITPCFRSEVGSWGKDVKGIKRVHQFTKLEMDVVCKPEESGKIFDELLEINEWFYQALKLPYRVIQKCPGDAGYLATHKQYDVEGWRPTEKEWMELGTDTNATDYQARTLGIKYVSADKKKRYAHTVNNTGVTDRALIMILENYQQKDGSVLVPKILREIVGKEKIE